MGFMDSVNNFVKEANRSMASDEIPASLDRLGQKSLALLQADRLDAEKMAKLAAYDDQLLQAFVKAPEHYLPGSPKEIKQMREVAKDAIVVCIEHDL